MTNDCYEAGLTIMEGEGFCGYLLIEYAGLPIGVIVTLGGGVTFL